MLLTVCFAIAISQSGLILLKLKKKVSLVSSYLNYVLSPAIETILFLGFYFHLSAF